MEKHPEGTPSPPDRPASPEKTPPPDKSAPPPRMSTSTMWLILVLAMVFAFLYFGGGSGRQSTISYGMFRRELARDNIMSVEIQGAGGPRQVHEAADRP